MGPPLGHSLTTDPALALPRTSGFMELQCHPCIKAKAEVVIEDIQGELKWKGGIRMRTPVYSPSKDEVRL